MSVAPQARTTPCLPASPSVINYLPGAGPLQSGGHPSKADPAMILIFLVFDSFENRNIVNSFTLYIYIKISFLHRKD